MVRRLHLVSGLVLFAYLALHLLNHALVLVSVEVADRWLEAIYPILTSAPVTFALLAAIVTHVGLALWALWSRRTLRFTGYEAVQYALGFALPLLLAPHILHTRVADSLYGADWGYFRNILLAAWDPANPLGAVQLGATVLCAWVHAVIGLRGWLRLRPWYPRVQPALLAVAVLLPALSLAALLAGRDAIAQRAGDAHFVAKSLLSAPAPEVAASLDALGLRARFGLVGAAAFVLLARQLRWWRHNRHGRVRISYPDGSNVTVPRGFSVLEASWLGGIPHASVCGGRGRCSTCRVRVRAAPGAAPAAGPEERRVLARIGAPPDTRLACQLRPVGPCSVVPLLDAAQSPRALMRFASPRLLGAEREVVVAFADLRDFTRLSDQRLPFDVVHLLNGYFRAMGQAVEAAGGRVDKFIGDGVMALFGTEGAPDLAAACRDGLDGARRMALAIAALNQGLGAEYGGRLRVGIGLHAGPAILGEMGHGRAMGLTAIGDTVNTASRLEAACKQFDCELVVSEVVLAAAGVTLGEPHSLEVRGRAEPLAVCAIARAAELPEPRRR